MVGILTAGSCISSKAVHDSSQDVDESLAEIRHGLLLELECRRASPVSCIDSGWYSILFPTRLIRKMLLAACGVAVAQAAIGSSAIVYYTPQVCAAMYSPFLLVPWKPCNELTHATDSIKGWLFRQWTANGWHHCHRSNQDSISSSRTSLL